MTSTLTSQPRTRRRDVVPDAVALQGVLLAIVVGADGAAVWRLVRVAAVAGLTLLARRGAWRPSVRIVVGFVGVIVGLGLGPPFLLKAGLDHPTTVVGLGSLLVGLAIFASGARSALRRVSPIARAAVVPVGAVVLAVVALTLVPALMATNVPPTELGSATPADVGFAYEDVTLATTDGVELAAWYIPSGNGAAVVVRHGSGSTRSNVLDHGAVLASHGYGVLLVDARGHGESGGRAMDFGWYGDLDIRAAVGFLDHRPEVNGDRIGVVGMSMGGEEAIGAAGTDGRIMAVVAEGVTGRSNRDSRWLSEEFGLRGALQEVLEGVRSGVTDLLTSASKPIALDSAVVAAVPRPLLLVAAGTVRDEQDVATRLAAASPETVATWIVPDAGHTDGLAVAPEEWESRVIAFLDQALE